MTTDPRNLPWRVGNKVGRTIYVIDQDAESGDADPLIGVMDTRELAMEAVCAHNEALRREQPVHGRQKPTERLSTYTPTEHSD